ncbi:MAG: SRPBCC domain-containing protein [Candidatus Acidiferrales bacterium]
MPEIRHAISIEAALAEVFPLISTGEGFTKWWAADVVAVPQSAETDSTQSTHGTIDIGFYNRKSVYRVELTRLSPPRQADWVCISGNEWTGTRLAFALKENNPGTLLLFTHSGWAAESDYFVSCNTTWGGLLFRLKNIAEGKTPGPLFTASGSAY